MVLLGVFQREPGHVTESRGAQLGSPDDRPGLGAEVRLRELTEMVVVHVAAGRDHDPGVHVVRVVVGTDRREVEARQGLAVPDDGAPERMLAEDGLAEVVVDELGRRILVHGDLFEHDLALLVEVGEGRSHQHLDHHLEGGPLRTSSPVLRSNMRPAA